MATAQNLELCLVRNLMEWLKHPQVIKHKAGPLFPSNRRPFVSVSKTTYRAMSVHRLFNLEQSSVYWLGKKAIEVSQSEIFHHLWQIV